MTQKYVIALDQGTTSTRAIAFDQSGNFITSHQIELAQHYPQPGWVEHNPIDILKAAQRCLTEVVNTVDGTPMALGITNQRETTVVWDAETGEPIYQAIVWQDRRTADFCTKLHEQGLANTVTEKTGLLLDPYFSGTKLAWILDNVDGARQNQALKFGTIETWLLWKLTNGAAHKTDISNASRTMLMNLTTQQWDAELLKALNIPENILPEICDNQHDFGSITIGGHTILITGMAGDQQAAAFGQACFEAGSIKSTYGTGAFVLLNCGEKRPVSSHKLLSTVAWRLNGKTTYALEGSIFIAGAVVQWLRDNVQIIQEAADVGALADSVDSNEGVYFVPAFTGLGAPHWQPNVRAAILGMTRSTNKAHIARAALEAIAYQTYDLLTAMQADSGNTVTNIRIDGGMANSDWFAQFLSSLLDCTVDRPKFTETTALGAAYLAGLHVGFYESQAALKKQWHCAKSFTPKPLNKDVLLAGWQQAIKAVS